MTNPDAPERVVARIKSRVEVNADGCWMWPGASSVGYGRICWTRADGRKFWGSPHRVMYAAVNGPIPEGMDVDHLCHDPAACQPEKATDCPHRKCCNPDHLAAVSRRENLLRGGTVAASRSAVTACPRGHDYTPANTITDSIGRRSCRTCGNERGRDYYWKNRERRKAYNKAWRAARKASQK